MLGNQKKKRKWIFCWKFFDGNLKNVSKLSPFFDRIQMMDVTFNLCEKKKAQAFKLGVWQTVDQVHLKNVHSNDLGKELRWNLKGVLVLENRTLYY